ncbi:MAG: hypothetical protein MUO23_04150 [Anaerolineales bacterium]|nr:hypothetical protein [Anaerolineales bacterium]
MPVQTRLGLRHLEGRLRAWPRTPANDRFFAASQQLAQAMHELAGRPV